MRHRHADRSNHYGDMAIFDFFQNGGRPPSCIFLRGFGLLAKSIWWSLSQCKILVGIGAVVSIIRKF